LSLPIVVWIIRIASWWLDSILDILIDLACFEYTILAPLFPCVIVALIKYTEQHNEMTGSVEVHGILLGDLFTSPLIPFDGSEDTGDEVLDHESMVSLGGSFGQVLFHLFDIGELTKQELFNVGGVLA
jgi:hypothetical protein